MGPGLPNIFSYDKYNVHDLHKFDVHLGRWVEDCQMAFYIWSNHDSNNANRIDAVFRPYWLTPRSTENIFHTFLKTQQF